MRPKLRIAPPCPLYGDSVGTTPTFTFHIKVLKNTQSTERHLWLGILLRVFQGLSHVWVHIDKDSEEGDAHRHPEVGVLVHGGVDDRAVVVRLVPEQKVLGIKVG